MELSEKLYKLRKDNNWSQEEIAEKMDVSRQTVSKWETNKAFPELNKLVKLSELYNITLDELVKDTIATEKIDDDIMYQKKKNKKVNIKILIFLIIVLLICFVIFTLNIIRRISILNDISSKYKSDFQSIGESKSGRIIEHITKREINNIKETYKEYIYYVSENEEKLLKIVDYEIDEFFDNPIEETYIDLTNKDEEGLYSNVTKVNLKDGSSQKIDDYEFDSPVLRVTSSLNNYYGIVWAWDKIPFESAIETVFDFNNKFMRNESSNYGWNNSNINNSKDNIYVVFNNHELYLLFENYEDDIKERIEKIDIQMHNDFQPTIEEVVFSEI